MYPPKFSSKEIIQCSACGAFYHRRHWTLTRPAGLNNPVHRHPVFCPACRKTRERYPWGELRPLRLEAGDQGELLCIGGAGAGEKSTGEDHEPASGERRPKVGDDDKKRTQRWGRMV